MLNLKFIALPIVAILFVASANTSHSHPNHATPVAAVASTWHLLLAHDATGKIRQGSRKQVANAVRKGCKIRVAWGARRKSDPTRTIEHIADPIWVSIRDGNDIEVQIGDYLINHAVLGEPSTDHPGRERFGGTGKVVKWRANLKADGTFDAIWFYPHSGELVTRVSQRYPMKWFADCKPADAAPLFSESGEG